MKDIEDAFWADRAEQLIRRAGGEHRVALVVRDGRVVAQVVHARGAPELTAIVEASPRAAGASLYVAHCPDPRAIELARRVRVATLVITSGAPVDVSTVRAWETAGVAVRSRTGS
jgi:hypothetical protein